MLFLVILCTLLTFVNLFYFTFFSYPLNRSWGEFTLRNMICSTLLVVSLVRLWLIIRPVFENIRSQGTDVATILQCFTNIFFRLGYTNWCFFHHSSGQFKFPDWSFRGNNSSDKYMSTSLIAIESGVPWVVVLRSFDQKCSRGLIHHFCYHRQLLTRL